MNTNPYIDDILAQPAALREALEHYPDKQIEDLRLGILGGEFHRIILTGMGSSYYSAYAAWLKMTACSVPTIHVNTAELLHFGSSLIDENTLLWMNSQSGRSAEIVRLLEGIKENRPRFQLSMTNSQDSPLALSADLAVQIHAGDEATVSTKTYINTAALLLLTAAQIVGDDWQALKRSMQAAADAIEEYLQGWQQAVTDLDAMLGTIDQLIILGRGPSMSAVWNGSLINNEAAKCIFEGMNVADFRHGPFELVSPQLTTIVFEGCAHTATINRELALEVNIFGGKSLWVSARKDSELPTIKIPQVDETALPLVEILPMQMLSIVMAKRKGIEPGIFQHIAKITEKE